MVLMMGTERVTRRKRMKPATGGQRSFSLPAGDIRVKKKAGKAERASIVLMGMA
jgi:hypothetical protein